MGGIKSGYVQCPGHHETGKMIVLFFFDVSDVFDVTRVYLLCKLKLQSQCNFKETHHCIVSVLLLPVYGQCIASVLLLPVYGQCIVSILRMLS